MLSLCGSVFKPVQHAAWLSPLKQHTDAKRHPSGPQHTHTHTHTRTRSIPCLFNAQRSKDACTQIQRQREPNMPIHSQSASLLLPLPQQSVENKCIFLSKQISGGLFPQRPPQFSLSFSLSSFASCNSLRWLPVDCWELVVLRSWYIKTPCLKEAHTGKSSSYKTQVGTPMSLCQKSIIITEPW